MPTKKKQGPRIVTTGIDVEAMVKDFGLHPSLVVEPFGLKSSTQKRIDAMKTPDDISDFDWSRLDKIDLEYYMDRVLKIAQDLMSQNATGLRELHLAYDRLLRRKGYIPFERLQSIMYELCVEILTDTTKRPKSYREAVEAKNYIRGNKAKDLLSLLIDGFIDKMVSEPTKLSLDVLVNTYKVATDLQLKSRLEKLLRGRSIDLRTAVEVASHFAFDGTPVPQVFIADVEQFLTQGFATAVDASDKYLLLRGSVYITRILPTEVYLTYAEIVFTQYLSEANIKSAKTMLENVFSDKDGPIKIEGVKERWEMMFAKAYDRVHLPMIRSETLVDKLRPLRSYDVKYSGLWKVALERLRVLLSEEIDKAPDDLEVLAAFLTRNEIDTKQKEVLYRRREPLLVEKLQDCKTREEFLSFWAILDEGEKELWRVRVLKASAHLYITTDNTVEIEIPA